MVGVTNGEVVGLASLPASLWLQLVLVPLLRVTLYLLNIYLIIKLVSERIIYKRVRQPGTPASVCRWHAHSISATSLSIRDYYHILCRGLDW